MKLVCSCELLSSLRTEDKFGQSKFICPAFARKNIFQRSRNSCWDVPHQLSARSDFIFRVCKTEWKVRHSKQEREITETLFPWVTKYTDVSLLWSLKLQYVCRSSTQHPVKVKHSISITARRQRKKSHSFRFKSVWTEPPPSPLLNNSQLTSPPLQPSSSTVNHKL